MPPPPSSYRIGVPHVDSLFGGGAPTYIAITGALLGAGALLEGAPATVEDQPSHTVAASSPWTDSITKGEQNGVP
jgi:hypothetical protein